MPKILVGRSEGKDNSNDLGVYGVNVKGYRVGRCGPNLVQNIGTLVNKVLNILLPSYLIDCQLPRRTLLRALN
jgi:hypothetical protein